MKVLMKAINNSGYNNQQTITVEDIVSDLVEICENEHSSCNNNCPIYRYRPDAYNNPKGCSCFKDGYGMYNALSEQLK